jgi:hypothetical protein
MIGATRATVNGVLPPPALKGEHPKPWLLVEPTVKPVLELLVLLLGPVRGVDPDLLKLKITESSSD